MSNKILIPLSEYLQTSRTKAGLTQKDISKKLGYTSPQFISNWERGISQPPLNVLHKLVKMYDLNRDELFDILLNQAVTDVSTDLREKFYG
jgi:transcriptional regulator with XRE-family HTH domain